MRIVQPEGYEGPGGICCQRAVGGVCYEHSEHPVKLDGDALVARLEAETMRANAAEDRATDEKERADAAERLLVRACEHIVGLVDGSMWKAQCQCRTCLAFAFLQEVGT